MHDELFEHLPLYSLQTPSRKSSGYFTSPLTPLECPSSRPETPLYATGPPPMHNGGGGHFNHPHNPLRLALYAINHALFLLAFLPLFNTSFYTQRSSCHELFAAPLQRPHSTLCYSILTHCEIRPFCLYPNTSCHDATPSTPLHLQVWGKTHSAAPFTHPTHARIIFFFYALLPYCFIPMPFLCYISASNFPNTTPS